VAIEATPESLAARRQGDARPQSSSVGSGVDSRVTIVHGFAQTSACIGPLADALAERHDLVLADAPGHGGSRRHLEADLEIGGDLLAATGGHSTYIGYSMGGRLSLHTALRHPGRVERLVLISATAGIEDDRERSERLDRDERHATRLEQIGLDAFIEEWLALPLFAGLPTWARFDAERRANSVEGLAGSLRHAGTGSMEPLWDRLSEIECPVLIVTGSRDERYESLGARMASTIGPSARHVSVPVAGHSTHLEQPSRTTAAILEFLGS